MSEVIDYGPLSPDDIEQATEVLQTLEDCFFASACADRVNAERYLAAFLKEARPANVRPLAEVQREALAEALRVYKGSVAAAAKALGIGRATAYRWIARDRVQAMTGGAS